MLPHLGLGALCKLRTLHISIVHIPQTGSQGHFGIRLQRGRGMGDETVIGLLHVTPKKHPLLIKRIGTTRSDHAPGCADCFPVVNLAKVDSYTSCVHLHCAL